MRWSYELTREELPHNAQRLEWALQIRQRRVARAIPTGRIPVHIRRIVGVVAAGLGLLGSASLRADPSLPDGDRSLLTGLIVFFTCALFLALVLPRFITGQRRWIGGLLARRAARLMASMERRTPTTLDYELGDVQLDVRCAAMPELRPIALGRYRFVMHTGKLVFAFPRLGTLRMRTIYVPDDAHRAAVLDAFTRHGAEAIELTGPLAEYADPLPPARAKR
jgi:hypothetical protein